MRLLISVLTACLLVSACGDSERARKKKSGSATLDAVAEILGAPAVKTSRLDLAACFAEDIADEASSSSRCPSFVLLQLDFLTQECALAGGTLRPVEQPVAWSLDVDGDASAEILVDLRQNMDCQGAPGVFSCGRLGCPYFLYAKRGDGWVELGAINADDAPGGLWTLTRDAPILASPEPDGQVLDEYTVGNAVVVIGNARGSPFKFVSPCNACRRGFVDETALKK